MYCRLNSPPACTPPPKLKETSSAFLWSSPANCPSCGLSVGGDRVRHCLCRREEGVHEAIRVKLPAPCRVLSESPSRPPARPSLGRQHETFYTSPFYTQTNMYAPYKPRNPTPRYLPLRHGTHVQPTTRTQTFTAILPVITGTSNTPDALRQAKG